MNKENMAYIHGRVLFSYKEEGKYVIHRKINSHGDHCAKQNNLDSQRQMLQMSSHVGQQASGRKTGWEGRTDGRG
jgi:alkylated DNA nucleotide flippase Atl1